ncbi:E3 ubiquitin ligase BIG [Musa troglodytarum]|uniref:E3 ubiquitin ligase BIG n=1 Tax=Musa troglodytarum TaxID=320322 RepID=A0A9E7KRR6_9LILI|nr:E3 ubiquitin ligase BIG [Musa troglodytarum]
MDSSRIGGNMSHGRQMEVHYIDTGFPYTVTESFMDLFEGLTYHQTDANSAEAFQDQGNAYHSTVQTTSFKYGFSSAASDSYYSFGHAYEINCFTPQLDAARRMWDDPVPLNIFDSPQLFLHGNLGVETRTPSAEECIQVQENTNDGANGGQAVWQDNIDPDNMTYEELLDLGEAVGTQSRGLTQEHISSLPVSKYKCGFFSRKKSQEERFQYQLYTVSNDWYFLV